MIDYGLVEVDFKAFDKAISEIEDYISSLEKNMSKAHSEIGTFLSSCQGPEISMYKSKWDNATGENSTYSEFIKALKSYLAYLKFARMQYKSVQSKAINQSNSL